VGGVEDLVFLFFFYFFFFFFFFFFLGGGGGGRLIGYSLDMPRSVVLSELSRNILLHRQHSDISKQTFLFINYQHVSFGLLVKLSS